MRMELATAQKLLDMEIKFYDKWTEEARAIDVKIAQLPPWRWIKRSNLYEEARSIRQIIIFPSLCEQRRLYLLITELRKV
jgi:hypothetical protein